MLRLQGERLADIVHTPPEPTAGVHAEAGDSPAQIDIERNLHFAYGEHEPEVLRGISTTIRSGESVAIIGPSGCGKSTLVHLLLGILTPTKGEIRIGGQPLQQLGLGTLRSMIGTVMQDDVLFAGSVADNIAFFVPRPTCNGFNNAPASLRCMTTSSKCR